MRRGKKEFRLVSVNEEIHNNFIPNLNITLKWMFRTYERNWWNLKKKVYWDVLSNFECFNKSWQKERL